MSPPCLASLGSINADFQMRVPQPLGQRETVAVEGLCRFSGGKAANVAFLARRLGLQAVLLGRVGDDDLARQALDPLREAGVDVQGVITARGEGTAVSVIAVPPDGKKNILLAGRANQGYTASDVAQTASRVRGLPAGAILVADYEVSPQVVAAAVREASGRGLRVVVDPSFPDAVERQDLRAVHALTPNVEEALQLAGVHGQHENAGLLEEAARRLAAMGPPVVCIKLKDGGCLLWHEGQAWRLRAASVEAVDATGAGDAFTGAFAVALLEGRPPAEAAALGVAAGEVAVQVFGSQQAYPDRQRLHAQWARIDRTPVRWE